MKNIAVFGDSKKVFQNYFESFLGSLKIEFNIANPNSPVDDKYFDYVVINNTSTYEDSVCRADYFLVNMDNSAKKNISINGIFLSYGIGGRNTITVSSLQDESFVYCMQRYLSINSKHTIEPQEIPVNIEVENEEHMYSVMAAITIALIEGASAEEIQKSFRKKIYIY